LSATCDRSVVPSTNKTDRYDITEILLKVALNTIKQTNKQTVYKSLSIGDWFNITPNRVLLSIIYLPPWGKNWAYISLNVSSLTIPVGHSYKENTVVSGYCIAKGMNTLCSHNNMKNTWCSHNNMKQLHWLIQLALAFHITWNVFAIFIHEEVVKLIGHLVSKTLHLYLIQYSIASLYSSFFSSIDDLFNLVCYEDHYFL
jgi:hypothetical protein